MGRLLAALLFGVISQAASAAEVTSVYTEADPDKNCVKVDAAAEGEGEWSTHICAGYAGYPVVISYDDARESVFYGFPPQGDANVWESFEGFNASSGKIEWRIQADGDKKLPFATIHRWSVANPEDPDKRIDVLVVEKVGQLGDQQGCAVGLVVATGNPQANETARKIADGQAREFACGADERTLVGEPMPTFDRRTN